MCSCETRTNFHLGWKHLVRPTTAMAVHEGFNAALEVCRFNIRELNGILKYNGRSYPPHFTRTLGFKKLSARWVPRFNCWPETHPNEHFSAVLRSFKTHSTAFSPCFISVDVVLKDYLGKALLCSINGANR